MLILVVGPSGAGKDTLLDAARAELAGDGRFRFVQREITRPADAGGEAHRAVSEAEFSARAAAGGYALWWRAHGLGYGIPADITDDLAAGRVVVANASRSVLAEAAARFPLLVLEITASPEVLAARLAARGRESAADIAERVRRSVALPAGLEVVTVVNDGTLAAGAARVVGVLRGARKQATHKET
jgi:phosphonate metabolism protein PhnN/1,5-bisphosphokinase (PRPP-forming)